MNNTAKYIIGYSVTFILAGLIGYILALDIIPSMAIGFTIGVAGSAITRAWVSW